MSSNTLPRSGPSGETPRRVKYIRSVDQIPQLSQAEREALREVTQRYALRANDYYLGLINWDDPNDPIRRLIIPSMEELEDHASLDPCNEASVTVARGVQHKYPNTVLLLCNETCGAYCRFCFRKRLFIPGSEEVNIDVSEGIRHIAADPNVCNVLLTGGDPLLMSTRRLRSIIEPLRAIPHVRIIRMGTKMPAFDPFRILDDPELVDLLGSQSTPRKRVYLIAHFDHPRELTDEAVAAIDRMVRAGVICANQCPIIDGINDDPEVLAELFSELSFIGCPPYYVFQCRPTAGNRPYAVPIVRGWEVFREALRRGSGLARRARYVMSHEQGKVEIVGVDRRRIVLRFHRAKNRDERGQLMYFHRNDEAYWLDDLEPIRGGGGHKYTSAALSATDDGPE